MSVCVEAEDPMPGQLSVMGRAPVGSRVCVCVEAANLTVRSSALLRSGARLCQVRSISHAGVSRLERHVSAMSAAK